jgi:hypothetical protein
MEICHGLAEEAFAGLGDEEATYYGLSAESFAELAALAGYLHDLGCFIEGDLHENPDGKNHVELGVDYLFGDNGKIRNFSPYPRFDKALKEVVANHALYRVDFDKMAQRAGLTIPRASGRTKEIPGKLAVVLTKLVRDADRVAIIERGISGWTEFDKTFGRCVTLPVLQVFEEKRMVRVSECAEENWLDRVMLRPAFVFGLNYGAAAERLMAADGRGRTALERLKEEVLYYSENRVPVEWAFSVAERHARHLANGLGGLEI